MYGTFCRACGNIILTHGKCKKECEARWPHKTPFRDYCEHCGKKVEVVKGKAGCRKCDME